MIYNSLTIDGQKYCRADLKRYSLQKINEINTPQWKKDHFRFINEWISPKRTIALKTSGSTGKPKIINVEKDKMVQSALLTGNYFNLKEGDCALLLLSSDYIAGKMMIVRSFVLKLNLIWIKPQLKPVIPDARIDFSAMVPTQFYSLLHSKDISRLNRLKTLIVGGSPMVDENILLLKKISVSVFETFGMTETLSHIAVRNLSKNELYFTLLDGVRIAKDKRGCLKIFHDKITGRWLQTNDIVELNGRQFRWLGRIDNIINIRGTKICPEDIEKRIGSLISKRRFYISSKERDIKGSKIILNIEGNPFDNDALKKLKDRLSRKLKKNEVPEEIYFIQKFSKTKTGKLKRKYETPLSFEKY